MSSDQINAALGKKCRRLLELLGQPADLILGGRHRQQRLEDAQPVRVAADLADPAHHGADKEHHGRDPPMTPITSPATSTISTTFCNVLICWLSEEAT